MVRFWLVLLCSIWLRAETAVDRAFTRMYNVDFNGAHAILNEYIAQQPGDPFGHVVRAASYLFSELDRLQILESEFFLDDKRIIEKKRLRPNPQVRTRFFAAVNEAERLAKVQLAAHPDDRNALFSMCLATGLISDYTSLIEKRQWGSLTYLKQSNGYALRLLKLEPAFYDAYLARGISEYLVGSLPFFLRWFVHVDQVKGSKPTAFRDLEMVAEKGRYLKPFAKILLAIAYLREKKPRESERLLAGLAREFPENPLLRRELDKVRKLR